MEKINRYAWPTLGILLGAQFVMSMGSFSYGPLAPFFRDSLGISRGQVGSLIALFYFTATLAAIPAGLFVDRVGARTLLILCLIMEGLPYAAMSLAAGYVPLIICSALSGLGYGVINQVSTKGIMNWFTPSSRATAMGIKQSGVTIGGAAAAWMLPLLSLAYNWKTGVLVVGTSMFFMALISFLFYRELPPERPSEEQNRLRRSGGQKSLLIVLSQPTLLALMALSPFLAFSHGSVVSFLVLYLKEHVHLPVQLAGMCLTASMIAAAFGRIGWGVISDRIFAGDRLKPVIILSLVGAASSLGVALLSPGASLGAALFWSILLGFSLSGWNAIVMVLSAELGGVQLAASVVSVVITFVGLGFLIGPLVFGYVADNAGYFSSWMTVVIASLLSLAGFVRIQALHNKRQS